MYHSTKEMKKKMKKKCLLAGLWKFSLFGNFIGWLLPVCLVTYLRLLPPLQEKFKRKLAIYEIDDMSCVHQTYLTRIIFK